MLAQLKRHLDVTTNVVLSQTGQYVMTNIDNHLYGQLQTIFQRPHFFKVSAHLCDCIFLKPFQRAQILFELRDFST